MSNPKRQYFSLDQNIGQDQMYAHSLVTFMTKAGFILQSFSTEEISRVLILFTHISTTKSAHSS